jgi:hypothetical protein
LTQGDYEVMWGVTQTLLTDGLATLDVVPGAPQFPLLASAGLLPRERGS